MESIIRSLKLSEDDVLKIVKEWYTNGMCQDIFQDESGVEIDEWVDDRLEKYF
ncbi:hypothetical protein UFOVP617_23 [uncultured Caudovirales phage]|uniref:Uncharacterized protein n=1 Tax=uncultured Caudovirales phage TaxID=2100421 RepID=A0A6J5N1P5_9CAUD|nr:hypothetical protein UFOVP617_23 [uncultured Caudovirales phage]